MKLISTGLNLGDNDYAGYIHNCNRDQTEPPYFAPLPNIGALQFYVDFGHEIPLGYNVTLVSLCADGETEQVFTSNYVVSETPDGTYYGVFKFFSTPFFNFKSFVVHFSALVENYDEVQSFKSWYSEAFEIVNDCDTLMKIKACMPEALNDTAFDLNGIYTGLGDEEFYLGYPEIRYYNIVYARQAKLRQAAPTVTFKQSLVRNFTTTIERNWNLVTELVPSWYKEYFLALYARGQVEIDNGGVKWLVKSVDFEPVNEDDLMWKPYATLHKTDILYYGCDDSVCKECCSPVVISVEVTYPSPCISCEPEIISAIASIT